MYRIVIIANNTLITVALGGRVFPVNSKSTYESSETEINQGKGFVGRNHFYGSQLTEFAGQAQHRPPPPAVAPALLPSPPLLAGTPWVGPWSLANARPIAYQEWGGRENGCFLSPTCPRSTEALKY